MTIDNKLLADLAVTNLNYNIVCDLFGLTPEERLSPNAGSWICDCIKQFQTASILAKSAKLRHDSVQSVSNYHPESMLPPNPLLPQEKAPDSDASI